MKHQLNAWLSDRVNFTGLLACGLRHADRSTASQVNRSSLATAKLDTTWHGLYDMIQSLRKVGIPCSRFDCTYAHLKIQGACRPDGSLLALITSDQPEPVDAVTLRGLIEEFLSLGT